MKPTSFQAPLSGGHLTPNARPANYRNLPGSDESVRRVRFERGI